jgi:metal-responsive CopG/Arc/MetJ family transcriptional regulator
MANDLKNRERFTSTLDKKLLSELQKLSGETMIPMSKLLDKAVEQILREYGKIK